MLGWNRSQAISERRSLALKSANRWIIRYYLEWDPVSEAAVDRGAAWELYFHQTRPQPVQWKHAHCSIRPLARPRDVARLLRGVPRLSYPRQDGRRTERKPA